jgi:hypothetical protein
VRRFTAGRDRVVPDFDDIAAETWSSRSGSLPHTPSTDEICSQRVTRRNGGTAGAARSQLPLRLQAKARAPLWLDQVRIAGPRPWRREARGLAGDSEVIEMTAENHLGSGMA